MANTPSLILFLVFVTASVVYGYQPQLTGFDSLLVHCCTVGSTWGSNHTLCTGPQSPIPGIPSNDRMACSTAIYICCIRFHRVHYCERGKQAARTGQTCVELPHPGGETYKDCCDGCSLGLKAGSLRMVCSSSNFNFGTPWDEAYEDCCVNSVLNPGTSSLTGGRCRADNPCNQICDDKGTEIECSCFPGYVLSSDLRTCEDINECELQRDTCNHATENCVNAPGSFQCVAKGSSINLPIPGSCPAGYEKNPTTQTCDDIDECILGACNTDTEVCINTIGSFSCSPSNTANCRPGFRLQQNTGRCIDVDECAEGRHRCDPNEELCLNSYGAYQCRPKTVQGKNCPAGFKWSDSQGICEDVDECIEGSHNCNRNTQDCLNEEGRYRCLPKVVDCARGYERHPVSGSCDDINECDRQIDDCDRTRQYCVNTPGSYQCHTKSSPRVPRCGIGYRMDVNTGVCKDINECDEIRPCLHDQTCENSQGSYKCVCQQGFGMDTVSRTCKDINECQLELHSCVGSQRCDNTIGSFTCVRTTSCGTGYTLNAGTNQCEDDDECILGSHNCGPGFACRNTLGSFRCDRVRCPTGQRLLSDGSCQVVTCSKGTELDSSGNCIDVNECLISNPCRGNQRCTNTVGSYRCQNLLNCGAGYELNEQGNKCVDTDECTLRTDDCSGQQICRNRPGGYTCECPPGHSLNTQRICEDIDECTRFRGQICSASSECQNTPGSYICNCKEGFKKAEDGRNCVDIDECADSPNICHQNCFNIWGSYKCTCKQGYTLSPDGRNCQDIDECSLFEGRGNLCIGFCVNEPGSYSCSCPDGYRLSSDKRTCQDIDECQEQNLCKGENQVCLNTRGSYKCNQITCPPNYERDRDHRNRCKRTSMECRHGDDQCLKDPLSISYNYITFVSNMRIPPSGQLDLFTMRGPRFTFTTVHFALELRDARAGYSTTTATREYFHLRRTAFNEAMVSLVKPIPGPQEIELELTMKMHHNGLFGGIAVAKIFIFVTAHEF